MMNYLNTSLLQSFIAMVLIVALDLCAEFFVFRKIKNKKKRARSKVVLRYILFFISIFILAKIWVEGFGHLLAFIGFISAALTIAEKENILNLTGGFIIGWRHSFVEGDYVQIMGYQGIVKELGLLSFTLEEIDPKYLFQKTGRYVKLPNSLVTLNPFVTFPHESFVIHSENFMIPLNKNLEIEKIVTELEDKLKKYFIEMAKNFSLEERKIYEKTIKKEKINNPRIDVTLELDENKRYKLYIQYYSLIHELIKVSSDVRCSVLEVLRTNGLLTDLG